MAALIADSVKKLDAAAHHSGITLAAGAFFGDACRTLQTPSFEFTELAATVPQREVPRHTHETAHFVLVLRGIYTTEAHNQDGYCSASTLIFNPAGTSHRDCFLSQNGRFLSITPGVHGSKLLEKVPCVARVIAGRSAHPLTSLVTRPIEREFAREYGPSAIVLESLGLELIGQLVQFNDGIEPRGIPAWLLRTREMIDDSAGIEISIAGLAAAAEVHPVYLARAFRKHFGRSPGEYMRRRRLLRVLQVLSETRIPLVEVALQCGFSDQSRMTHALKSEFGIAPGQYRRQRLQ